MTERVDWWLEELWGFWKKGRLNKGREELARAWQQQVGGRGQCLSTALRLRKMRRGLGRKYCCTISIYLISLNSVLKTSQDRKFYVMYMLPLQKNQKKTIFYLLLFILNLTIPCFRQTTPTYYFLNTFLPLCFVYHMSEASGHLHV